MIGEGSFIPKGEVIAEQETEKQIELWLMQERIHRALEDPEAREAVVADFSHTFRKLGLSEEHAQNICDMVLAKLSDPQSLDVLEQEILDWFEQIYIEIPEGSYNLIEALHEQLRNRAELIFIQIEPHLTNETGRMIDYGAGDGQVTQLLHDRLGLDIEGVDVRHYPALGVTVPILLFSGKRVDVADGTYEVAVMTNVAHHEKDNEVILAELSRIVTRKLVIIETVPTGDSPEAIERDRERTFMNDYLYNRLFHNADVPVPGTYETPDGWKDRIEAHGWHCTHSEDLGYDQPTIRDVHHLLVFER